MLLCGSRATTIAIGPKSDFLLLAGRFQFDKFDHLDKLIAHSASLPARNLACSVDDRPYIGQKRNCKNFRAWSTSSCEKIVTQSHKTIIISDDGLWIPGRDNGSRKNGVEERGGSILMVGGAADVGRRLRQKSTPSYILDEGHHVLYNCVREVARWCQSCGIGSQNSGVKLNLHKES